MNQETAIETLKELALWLTFNVRNDRVKVKVPAEKGSKFVAQTVEALKFLGASDAKSDAQVDDKGFVYTPIYANENVPELRTRLVENGVNFSGSASVGR